VCLPAVEAILHEVVILQFSTSIQRLGSVTFLWCQPTTYVLASIDSVSKKQSICALITRIDESISQAKSIYSHAGIIYLIKKEEKK
jgi:hypothetical protein